MTRSRSELAEALDGLVANGRVALTETSNGIVVYQLNGQEASRVLALLVADGWPRAGVSDEGGELAPDTIEDDFQGITIRVAKPGVPAGVEALLTRAGLEAALQRPDLPQRIWVQGLNEPFETLTVRYGPWQDHEPFTPLGPPPSPRRVVRVLSETDGFPDDLGRWLLRDPGAPVEGRGIQPWRRAAVEKLGKALADEIEPDGKLLFRGPPATRFNSSAEALVEASALEAIQRAAQWVFDNPRELENRHVLIAAEVARTAVTGGSVTQLATITGPALEGARIAYNFGVTQQSRDTLKALSELRKNVGDETAKLAESTRNLATAVAGSVFANIGIIVARLTIPATSTWVPTAAIVLGIVLAIYVGAVIWSGVHYLKLQETLRTEWRGRLYRFLDDAEYERMVTVPVRRAEGAFRISAWAGGIMSLLLLASVWLIAGSAE